MTDEPTGWELRRSLDQILEEQREMRRELNARFDRVVTADLFAAHVDAENRRIADAEAEIAAIQEDRKHEGRERAKATRAAMGALVTAFIAPIIVAVILRLVLGG